jgi:hypothetical protein
MANKQPIPTADGRDDELQEITVSPKKKLVFDPVSGLTRNRDERTELNLNSDKVKTAFSIDNFRAKVNQYGGFQKTNRFYVEIFSPVWTQDTAERFRFLCESAELPGKSITTNDAKIYGPAWKVATGTVYNEIVLTFLCTNDMREKIAFETWMNVIQNPKTYHMLYRDFYVGTISIIQLSELTEIAQPTSNQPPTSLLDKIPSNIIDFTFDTFKKIKDKIVAKKEGTQTNEASPTTPEVANPKVYWVKLIDAFPVSIAPVPLNWSDDGYMRIQVTFAYQRWDSISEAIMRSSILDEVLVQSKREPSAIKVLQKISSLVNSANKENLKNMAVGRLENIILNSLNDNDGQLRQISNAGTSRFNNALNVISERIGFK